MKNFQSVYNLFNCENLRFCDPQHKYLITQDLKNFLKQLA